MITTRDIDAGGTSAAEIGIENPGHIPASEVSPLFEPFYTKGKKGGTELRLAIMKKIGTTHGGRVWCESEGGGNHDAAVEFKIALPARVDTAGTQQMDLGFRMS